MEPANFHILNDQSELCALLGPDLAKQIGTPKGAGPQEASNPEWCGKTPRHGPDIQSYIDRFHTGSLDSLPTCCNQWVIGTTVGQIISCQSGDWRKHSENYLNGRYRLTYFAQRGFEPLPVQE